MPQASKPLAIYLEIGKKRTFASAIDWPGWCRAGKDEDGALETLLAYGPRYAQVLQHTPLDFTPPNQVEQLNVVERIPGNASTDFGAPGMAATADDKPVDEAELQRFQTLLRACWRAFDLAVQEATGKELRKGPRGGGRELDAIVEHVWGAEASYLVRLAWRHKKGQGNTTQEELLRTRQAVLDALTSAVREGLPARGPRGGVIWTPRYFVRRVAWHALDHAWEIEDRLL